MTTSDPRDRAAPSDSRFDAAWRTLSSEEPPKSLDTSILAAARREVGAGPQKIGPREAMADRRRWWPLAAAATVAAIAVGILQLTPPDQIGAPASDTTIVSDVPAPAPRPAPETPTTPSRSEEPKSEAGNALRAGKAPTRADLPRRQTLAPESRAPAKGESASENTLARAEPFPPAPLAKVDAGRAAAVRVDAARTDEGRAKDRAPLPVAEWIALIRRLRDEGKSADTAKELAAFRAVHADHENLLPPDLRNWRPPEK